MNFFAALVISVILCLGTSLTAQTVSTFAGPNIDVNDGLIQAADGTIYGSRFGGSYVYRVTPNGDVTEYMGGFSAPNGLAFDADSNLVVADHFGNQVYKVMADSTKVPFGDTLNTPAGVIKDPLSDTLYVAQYSANKVVKMPPDGSIIPFINSAEFDGPVGMAWDENNRLYIANFNDGKIFRVDGSTLVQIATVPGNSFSAIGFIAYGAGKIYATGIARHRIYEIDPATGVRTTLAGTGVPGTVNGPAADARFHSPNGILFDERTNNIYVSDGQTRTLRLITGVVTGISLQSQPGIAEAYQLDQNYPNPFNPSTTIRFRIPEAETVQLTLYDMSGRIVSNLVNGNLPAGEHQLTFEAAGLASGVYTYRLKAGNYLKTKRMILLK
ncbi:MAG: T9SS type A sorting domain-containing protein [Calditrichia bacterium]